MEDDVRKAEELLEERLRRRTSNGVPAAAAREDVPPGPDAEALTRELQRMAADFANYRKRNEAERADFARYAKSDLIGKLRRAYRHLVRHNTSRALELIDRDPTLSAPEVTYLVNFILTSQRGVILRRPSKRVDDLVDVE